MTPNALNFPSAAADAEGRTPLHGIARWRHVDQALAHTLVLAGGSLEAVDHEGLTPLEVAYTESNEFRTFVLGALDEQASFLVRRYLNRRGGQLLTPLPTLLYRSAACGQLGALHALLSSGHSPNVAARKSGATPLIVAAQLGDGACVEQLLQASADADEADRHGNTAAFYAARSGHWHCLRSLLAAGASCSTACSGVCTPLHVAARQGEEQRLQLALPQLALLCAPAPAAG